MEVCRTWSTIHNTCEPSCGLKRVSCTGCSNAGYGLASLHALKMQHNSVFKALVYSLCIYLSRQAYPGHSPRTSPKVEMSSTRHYKWSAWGPPGQCERPCKDPSGWALQTRKCLKCVNGKCGEVKGKQKVWKCTGESHKNESCYDAHNCEGPGLYTGEWAEWTVVSKCTPEPETKPWICNTPDESAIWSRDCHDTPMKNTPWLNRTPPPNGPPKYLCPNYEKKTVKKIKCNCTNPDWSGTRVRKFLRNAVRWRRSSDKPIQGQWGPWGPWRCAEKCDNPQVLAIRFRECTGKNCLVNPETKIGSDMASSCLQGGDVICHKMWGGWLPWSTCSVTCEQGVSERHRVCEGHGRDCLGSSWENRQCFGPPCLPKDGKWSPWGDWSSDCSVTCGDGVRSRRRDCMLQSEIPVSPERCEGGSIQTKPCSAHPSCIDLTKLRGWGAWSEWLCGRSCGLGVGFRTRHCRDPEGDCQGPVKEFTDLCRKPTCPNYVMSKVLPPAIQRDIKQYHRITHHNLELNENKSAHLQCAVDLIQRMRTMNLTAELFWLRNNETIARDPRYHFDSKFTTLTFTNMTSRDSGVYYCLMEMKEQFVILDLFAISVEPSFKLRVDFNSQLNLTCNSSLVQSVFPNTTVTWIHNGSKDMDGLHTVTIRNASEQDAGLWKCQVIDTVTGRWWTTNSIRLTLNTSKVSNNHQEMVPYGRSTFRHEDAYLGILLGGLAISPFIIALLSTALDLVKNPET